ncbi:hypothetical protein, partial [Vibrio cholerae]|uniref:hypothetical protein n=1 Tax=Vibrio cholerae TaxID=666 RepID=UPI00301DD215
LFYQTATFSEHPQSSTITNAAVVIFNLVLFILLRNARNRLTINLSNKSSLAKQCCSKGSCH